jgi:hypothetical protein
LKLQGPNLKLMASKKIILILGGYRSYYY